LRRVTPRQTHNASPPPNADPRRAPPEGPASARSADFLTRQSWLALLGGGGRFTRPSRNRSPCATRIAAVATARFFSGATIETISRQVVRERVSLVFFPRPRRRRRPDCGDALSVEHRLRAANQTCRRSPSADRAIEQELRRLISKRFPRSMASSARENGINSGQSAILGIFSTRSMDEELHFRNAAVRNVDCSFG